MLRVRICAEINQIRFNSIGLRTPSLTLQTSPEPSLSFSLSLSSHSTFLCNSFFLTFTFYFSQTDTQHDILSLPLLLSPFVPHMCTISFSFFILEGCKKHFKIWSHPCFWSCQNIQKLKPKEKRKKNSGNRKWWNSKNCFFSVRKYFLSFPWVWVFQTNGAMKNKVTSEALKSIFFYACVNSLHSCSKRTSLSKKRGKKRKKKREKKTFFFFPPSHFLVFNFPFSRPLDFILVSFAILSLSLSLSQSLCRRNRSLTFFCCFIVFSC